MDYTTILITFAVVLASLTVHEAAHAWSADRLGDPTARLLGRVSLNPIVHIDVLGTVVLPLIAAISSLPIIGWAKPVPVTIGRLRNRERDFVLVAAAGPASNLVLAAAGAAVFALTNPPLPLMTYAYGSGPAVPQLCFYLVEINVLLAVFNMVPIPPLDGGNVLAGLLPPRAAFEFDRLLRPYGFLLLYVLMFSGVLSSIIMPPATFLMRMLLQ